MRLFGFSLRVLKCFRYTYSWKKCLLRKPACVCGMQLCKVLSTFIILALSTLLQDLACGVCSFVLDENCFARLFQLSEPKDPEGHELCRMRQICRIGVRSYCYTSTRSLFQVTYAALMAGNTALLSSSFQEEFCKLFNFLAECGKGRQNTDFVNYLIAC